MNDSAYPLKQAVAELYARYAHYFDSENLEPFLALFTEDATVTLTLYGEEPISLNSAAMRGLFSSTIGGGARHLISNIVVDLNDRKDIASGAAYVQAYTVERGGVQLLLMGKYVDTFRKELGVWRFHEHQIIGWTRLAGMSIPTLQK